MSQQNLFADDAAMNPPEQNGEKALVRRDGITDAGWAHFAKA